MSVESEDTAEPVEAEEESLSFEDGLTQTQAYASQTKTYVAELPEGGVWEFEYGMIDNEEQIMQKHTNVKDTRSGQIEDVDMWAVRADIFCAGVKDAPEGFPLSPTKLGRQDAVVKKIVREVADAIIDYSTADRETVQKFH